MCKTFVGDKKRGEKTGTVVGCPLRVKDVEEEKKERVVLFSDPEIFARYGTPVARGDRHFSEKCDFTSARKLRRLGRRGSSASMCQRTDWRTTFITDIYWYRKLWRCPPLEFYTFRRGNSIYRIAGKSFAGEI